MFNWISARGNKDRCTKYILVGWKRTSRETVKELQQASTPQPVTVSSSIKRAHGWVRTCKELKRQLSQPACLWCFSHADHKVIYLRSASYAAIWFHFSAAVITLDWILEHKMQWVPYEKLPLNWESLAIWRHVSPLVPSTSQWENLT